MRTTLSRDDTPIAYDTVGAGPRLVLVDGALCTRSLGPGKALARRLATHFTVTTYDRRGRGDSGDSPPYAVEREVDDLEAVIDAAGGEAFVFGQSSGAVLALHAASRSSKVTRIALYEAPFVVDDTRAPTGPEYYEQLTGLLARGKRGSAVRLFLDQVGLPAVVVAGMRLTPLWPRLKAIAHTLPYDALITVEHQQGRPLSPEQWAAVRQPTCVLCGGDSDAWMRNGMHALADVLPNASLRVLDGQTHNLRAKAVAPELLRFFGDAPPPAVRPAA
ncbi:MAG: alpha/beta fold hydrolase [Solirubrobacteraceae bacterium]